MVILNSLFKLTIREAKKKKDINMGRFYETLCTLPMYLSYVLIFVISPGGAGIILYKTILPP